MKANNLSISIPDYGCNKGCSYCISKMTGKASFRDFDLMVKNIPKVKLIADKADVTNVSFTSKGEIFDSKESTTKFIKLLTEFGKYYPCEVQTNGIYLSKNSDLIRELVFHGIDTFAFSIDSPTQMYYLSNALNAIKEFNKTIRFTVNLVPSVYEKGFKWWIDICRDNGIHQLSFRTITKPTYPVDTVPSHHAQKWIDKNIEQDKVENFLQEYYVYIEEYGQHIRTLPYGAKLYMIEGISCTHFGYCIQDENSSDDIRSLILFEDGHLATNWYGSNYGRII